MEKNDKQLEFDFMENGKKENVKHIGKNTKYYNYDMTICYSNTYTVTYSNTGNSTSATYYYG